MASRSAVGDRQMFPVQTNSTCTSNSPLPTATHSSIIDPTVDDNGTALVSRKSREGRPLSKRLGIDNAYPVKNVTRKVRKDWNLHPFDIEFE